MPIINSLKQQRLLINYSSPYNKFKILIKANFKIQVTKYNWKRYRYVVNVFFEKLKEKGMFWIRKNFVKKGLS
jgi:hypothetical protein